MIAAMPKASTAPVRSIHGARRARLRDRMASLDIDAMLVSDPVDVAYLTGFLGGDSELLVPVSARAKPTVISDFRYQEELEPIAHEVRIHIRDGSMDRAVAAVCEHHRVTRCGVQGGHVTFERLAAIKRSLGSSRVRVVSGLVRELRRSKDTHEVSLIRKAIRIQEQALVATLETIEVGQTELEVAARLEFEMKARGSTRPGFPTIVAAGANASLPHYRPGRKRIRPGTWLLIDWGAVWQGYHGDMTRTFAVGRWTRRMREIYAVVHEAQRAAAQELAPGRTSHEIDAIARGVIERAGYGHAFGHGLGHGMGLEGHEDPRLNPLYPEAELVPGDVVTIEPGIYVPGHGGVRIEDDYVVTDRSSRNLCTLATDERWATLCDG